MRLTSLSLLHVAIWQTSIVLALVAAPPLNLEARADITPEYPKGHDAKSCPLDSSRMIILHASPATSKPAIQPAAAAALRASIPSKTQKRDLTPEELAQICRQVAHFPFSVAARGADYRSLTMQTSTVEPGLYVATAKANMVIWGLTIREIHYPWNVYTYVWNNQDDHIGVRFQNLRSTQLQIDVFFNGVGVVGELDLFKMGPNGWRGPRS
ncbi:hypothetical protein MMC16_003364 [Acarospora aff. strigata]|nr:hypothetical protein [Acarospora aff. strigata]